MGLCLERAQGMCWCADPGWSRHQQINDEMGNITALHLVSSKEDDPYHEYCKSISCLNHYYLLSIIYYIWIVGLILYITNFILNKHMWLNDYNMTSVCPDVKACLSINYIMLDYLFVFRMGTRNVLMLWSRLEQTSTDQGMTEHHRSLSRVK